MTGAGSRLADRMVFVVGAQRSGTTWLQRMLASHPDVLSIPPETHLFDWGMSVLRDQTQGGVLTSAATGTWFMPPDEFAAAARVFCDAAFGSYVDRVRTGALRVLERSPGHVWHLGLIAAAYPDAWVVHIVRDGRDVVRSQVAHAWGPDDVAASARQWASAVHCAKAASPGVPRYLEVRYEDLLARPERILAVMAFLDLETTGDVVDRALLEGGLVVNVDPSRPEVAEGKWRHEWSAADLQAFERVAGDALVELGYAPAEPGSAPEGVQPQPAAAESRRRFRLPRLGDRSASARPTTGSMSGEADQRIVDRLLSAAAVGDLAELLGSPTLTVRVVAGTTTWSDSGPTAASRLLEQLASEGPWGDPRAGEQEIHGGSWTVVLEHRAPTGTTSSRVVVVTFGPGLAVSRIRHHVLSA